MATMVVKKNNNSNGSLFCQAPKPDLRPIHILWLFLLFLLTPSDSNAHPISLSDAYVEVKEHKLLIKLEVFVEDLYLFHDLKLNKEMMLPLSEVKRGAKLHEEFLQKRFKILDQQGNRLPLKFVKRIDDDLPDFDIHMVHLMFFKLVYKYEVDLKEQPQYLTFLQEFIHEKVILPAEVLLKVKPQHGKRQQKVLLPNQPWTVRLDAKDDSADDEKLTPQQQLEKERSQTLGITSYGETYAFLYLEPEETRLEILIPLATIAGSLDMKLKPDGILDLEDQQKMKEPIRKLLEQQISLTVDEKPLLSILDRLDFFGVAFRDFSQRAEPRKISIANARLGIILRYPRPALAKTGLLKWNLFNQYLYQANLAVIEADETKKETLRKIEKQNEFTWPFPALPDSSIEKNNIAKRAKILGVNFQPGSSPYQFLHWLMLPLFFLQVCILVIIWRFLKHDSGYFSAKSFYNAFLFYLAMMLVFAPTVFIHEAISDVINQAIKPQIQEKEFPQITETLLTEIYAAFNKRDEERVFSRLEEVVDGELLRTLYLEIRQSMTIEEQGGAVARAGKVKLTSCTVASKPEPPPQTNPEKNPQDINALYLKCKWEVPGSVEHWGHLHQRTTSYVARLTIAPRKVDDLRYQWKLTGIELLNQDQSVLKTSVRNF